MSGYRTIIERVVAAYRKDPRKSVVMAGLAVVMLALWIRAASHGPATAVARPTVRPIPTAPPVAITSGDPAVLNWLAGPRIVRSTNLFRLNPDDYPAAVANEDAGFSARAEKSDKEAADQEKQAMTAADQVRTEAAKLRLQSTVLGATPMAVIDGQLMAVGDTIGLFVVVKIEARKVVVTRDGVTAVVEMK